eukprot:10728619-Heterocapsa_arctica.AAC.1
MAGGVRRHGDLYSVDPQHWATTMRPQGDQGHPRDPAPVQDCGRPEQRPDRARNGHDRDARP